MWETNYIKKGESRMVKKCKNCGHGIQKSTTGSGKLIHRAFNCNDCICGCKKPEIKEEDNFGQILLLSIIAIIIGGILIWIG